LVSAVSNDRVALLSVATETRDATVVLTPRGVLDSSTYRPLRDKVIKAALDEPRAVIVDVTDLDVSAESAWAVFTSARWHVGRWPEVPIVLVSEHSHVRSTIARNGVTRYVPVYPTIQAALGALSHGDTPRTRRRARAQLVAETASLHRARELVTEWLTAWSQTEMIPVAKVVVTAFVENVLQHTDSAPSLRLEFDGSHVTVAVEDASREAAEVQEHPASNTPPSGLRIISALCKAWGNAPTSSGKTVWAVIGPENIL
jgi:anti-anti-sigma factor